MKLTLPIILTPLALLVAGCARTTAPPLSDDVAVAPTTVSEPPLPERTDYTETIRGTTLEIRMVWIPEGEFWIGKTEVTWDQFLPYCDFDGDSAPPPGADAVSKPSKPLDGTPYDRDWGTGARPAVGMSWNAAQQYCKWLSLNTGHTFRLPTEAEWELACGPAPDDVTGHAWCDENSQSMTHETGTLAPNAHGVHDMFGNLWEYCANPYDPADPKRAVLRGGSWRDQAADISPTKRLRFDNDWTLMDPNVPPGVWWIPDGDHLGFRVLRPAKTDPEDGGPDGTNEP